MATKCPKCDSDNPPDSKFCKECGTQLIPSESIPEVTKTLETPVPKLNIGTVFANRYEILGEVGHGGMGEVYRVKDMKLDEEMALKVLKPEIAAYKETIERFKTELKLARKISHKNVCRMYDLNEEGIVPYITMEYIKGEDLKSLIKREEKLEEEVVAVAKQVCEGLSEAHRLGVVHRDLKPQNIMIDEKGNAKVMDFGIARSVEAAGFTQTGVMIGTPDYISPEQAEGKEADHRSDIYSLGVILYEMVTGSVPFKGDTALSIALKHKAQRPRDPKKLNPDISDDLSRLILICMEKDRERRYQTAEALLSDLQNIEDGIPLGTKIKPRRATFAQTIIRNKFFIPAVVAALAVIFIIMWQLMQKKEMAPAELKKPSIAVLPFEDLSPRKDQDYLCDGLAESLINALTHIQDLRIPARASSFSFKDKEKDIREIGHKLDVGIVLEGSVQKSGNRIRITAQLINVEDESLIWSEQYNRELDDVFAIQDDIALSVVDKLKLNLYGGEKAQLLKRYTENAEAYELYLKGRYFWDKRTHEAMKKGIGYFQEAIGIDPEFALAYTGISDCYVSIGWYTMIPKETAYEKAKKAAEKAIEIDETLSEAHVSLANVKTLYYWDWEGAEKAYRRALELNPSNAEAHHQYAHLMTMTGWLEDGVAEMKRAIELEPLSTVINSCLGQNLYFARKYNAAIEQSQKAIELDPTYYDPHGWLGMAYLNMGDFDRARSIFQKGATFPRFKTRMLGALGYAFAREGKRNEAQNVLHQLRELSEKQYVDPCYMAWIHTGLGKKEIVFEWLDKGYEEKSNWMIMLKADPFFDSLRSDPRFKILLGKMGLD